MKIEKKSNRSKKLVIVIILLLLVLAGGYGAYAIYSKPGQSAPKNEDANSTNSNVSTPTDEQNEEPPSTVTTNNSSKPQSSDDAKETPTSSDNDTTRNDLSVSLSSVQQHGSTLQVRTLINEVTDEGTCTLSLEKDGKKITRSTTVQALPSSSTCKGFDIDVSALATGQWNIVVNVTAGSSKGTAKGTVTLK
ncbi:MAG TPA: hypothetical protein VGE13_04620 [Candidatus Saccharimonadales bacterium]